MLDINNSSSQAMLRKFGEYLERKGMRKTPEREALVRGVLSLSGHFTVDQLQQQVVDEGLRVSRATVYNTVELLIDAGIVRRHVFEGMQQAQYERIGQPHTHLICTHCGKLKEVRDANLAAFMNARRFTAFNSDHYSLYVYGTCSTCARKLKRGGQAAATSASGKGRRK